MTNLRTLNASRKKPSPGDVFRLRLVDEYLFGRVILSDMPRDRAPMPGSYLIYVYDVVSAAPTTPPLQTLTPARLLIPPLYINRLPWTKGFFETAGHAELGPGDLLAQHCFRDTRGRYLDDSGRLLPGPIEPCGDWALYSYRVLDDAISEALGVPLAAE